MDTKVFVPVRQGRILKNAVGSSHGAVIVNLGLIELTDEERKEIEIKPATLVFDDA